MFDIYLYIYIPGVSEYMTFIHFIYVHTWSLSVWYILYTPTYLGSLKHILDEEGSQVQETLIYIIFNVYNLFNKSVPFKMFYKIYYIYTQNSQERFNYQINVPET